MGEEVEKEGLVEGRTREGGGGETKRWGERREGWKRDMRRGEERDVTEWRRGGRREKCREMWVGGEKEGKERAKDENRKGKEKG